MTSFLFIFHKWETASHLKSLSRITSASQWQRKSIIACHCSTFSSYLFVFFFFLYFSRIIRSLSDVWYRVTNRDKNRGYMTTMIRLFLHSPSPLFSFLSIFWVKLQRCVKRYAKCDYFFYLARCYRKRVK